MRSLVRLDSVDLRALACPWCGRTPRGALFGWKAVRDGAVVGAVACAPASQVGDVHPPGSVVIVQMWVRQPDLGELIGTQLIQRLAAAEGARRVRRIIAPGTLGTPDCAHLPGVWLEGRGFVECVRGKQWKLDLRSTVRVQDAVRGVVDAFVRATRAERPASARGTPSVREELSTGLSPTVHRITRL
ncbi:hypothetical protein PCC79_00125 [Propioniciclava soli]|uniref:N-acetyltransferase domain-containing protein n=1 Tax=Propioniciclava soli TaxID=2775081 RepID=A0ABZ3C799_9ACTN